MGTELGHTSRQSQGMKSGALCRARSPVAEYCSTASHTCSRTVDRRGLTYLYYTRNPLDYVARCANLSLGFCTELVDRLLQRCEHHPSE